MSMSRVLAVVYAFILAGSAAAQSPLPAPAGPPPPPRAEITLEQKVDRLTAMTGRQIVILDESNPVHVNKYFQGAQSNPRTDNTNATQVCAEVLGDRFGRMISYRKTIAEAGLIYFNRIVCETK